MVGSNPSDAESLSGPRNRQRVTKACQRCRLKKCKCDGHSPCTRCKTDDAICAYPKHQHFEKIVYRKGYVQMLERQQAQLIAGIQGLHQMNQTGERVPVEPLEANRIGQPLVHQILQKLGVLDAGDPWDEIEPDICKSESPSAEADAAFDPPVLPETQCVWPSVMNAGDFNSCRPKAASSTSSHGWGIPLAGNARLGPGTTTRSYQFLSVEDSQSWKPNLPLATDVADGRIVDKLRFGPNAMTETRMEYFTQPFSNCLVADPDSFSYSTMGQCASSNSGRPFVGKNVTGLDDGSTGQFSFM